MVVDSLLIKIYPLTKGDEKIDAKTLVKFFFNSFFSNSFCCQQCSASIVLFQVTVKEFFVCLHGGPSVLVLGVKVLTTS